MSEPGDNWLDSLDDPTPPAPKVTEAQLVATEEKDYFRDIQATLYEQAAKITGDALLFAEIKPGAEGPPEEWVIRFGEKDAWAKFRMAQAAWMSSKDAPVGLQMAQRQVLGIMKAKATEEAAPRSLSITLVQGGPLPVFPEKTLEDGKGEF